MMLRSILITIFGLFSLFAVANPDKKFHCLGVENFGSGDYDVEFFVSYRNWDNEIGYLEETVLLPFSKYFGEDQQLSLTAIRQGNPGHCSGGWLKELESIGLSRLMLFAFSEGDCRDRKSYGIRAYCRKSATEGIVYDRTKKILEK